MSAAGRQPNRKQRRQQRLATLTPVGRRDSLQRVAVYLSVWMRALDEQAARLRDLSVLNGGSDNWLYALALGTTLRSVHLAGVLDVDKAAALRRIDPAVPDAKKVRDVLEHLGDYELGVGDVQPPGQRRLECLYSWDDEGMAYIELQGVGVRRDLREAHAAARQLVEDTEAAMDAALDA